jgi:hypothetical protein
MNMPVPLEATRWKAEVVSAAKSAFDEQPVFTASWNACCLIETSERFVFV